jgi:hypothetical protein
MKRMQTRMMKTMMTKQWKMQATQKEMRIFEVKERQEDAFESEVMIYLLVNE